MAVIWTERDDERCYQIRSAGKSVRLYTNGVLHSQYNPGRVFGGGVWDLLVLPAVWKDFDPKRILMLGLGGGSVVRQLEQLVAWDQFLAVDVNRTHIRIARRFFDVNMTNTRLILADALQWLQAYAGPSFDLIVDDLFADTTSEAFRAIDFDHDWLDLLRRHLSPGGVITANLEDRASLIRSVRRCQSLLQEFSAAYRLETPTYGNAVLALSLKPRTSNQLRHGVLEIKPRSRTARLRYRIHRIPLRV